MHPSLRIRCLLVLGLLLGAQGIAPLQVAAEECSHRGEAGSRLQPLPPLPAGDSWHRTPGYAASGEVHLPSGPLLAGCRLASFDAATTTGDPVESAPEEPGRRSLRILFCSFLT